jgi:hypothetical protein
MHEEISSRKLRINLFMEIDGLEFDWKILVRYFKLIKGYVLLKRILVCGKVLRVCRSLQTNFEEG